MTVELKRKLFTIDEYEAMIETGVLTVNERLELIRGEIVEVSPIGKRHAACVSRLTELLVSKLIGQAQFHPQNPVRLPNNSEPEPDMMLVKPRADSYAGKRPEPEDVLLLIAIADSTLYTDRRIKIPLYAEAAITEMWLVDLGNELIEVYRRPTPDGYQTVTRHQRGDRIAAAAFPDVTFAVEDILGHPPVSSSI